MSSDKAYSVESRFNVLITLLDIGAAWTLLPLRSSFTNGTRTPQYRYDPGQKVVRLRGTVVFPANLAAGTVFATLPAGFVPTNGGSWVTSSTMSGYALGNATVTNAGGTGDLKTGAAGSTGNGIDLDNIAIPLD